MNRLPKLIFVTLALVTLTAIVVRAERKHRWLGRFGLGQVGLWAVAESSARAD
jgi:hypothetical protein